jgi:hypothetical protein
MKNRNAQVGIIIVVWFLVAFCAIIAISAIAEKCRMADAAKANKARQEMVTIVRQAIREERDAEVQKQATDIRWMMQVEAAKAGQAAAGK